METDLKIFGMAGDEAVAMYFASLTVLGMMQDEKELHQSAEKLESAVLHWHAFLTKRGFEVEAPASALKSLRRQRELKIL